MDEFYPLASFYRLMRFWWALVLAALIGGLAGYSFHLGQPPIYEADASFFVSIDASKTRNINELTYQYDEDISLAVIERILWDPAVLTQTSEAAKAQGITVSPADLFKNGRTERMHATWRLLFRSPDPQTAQTVVNLWAEQGYQTLLAWDQSGKVVDYVIYEAPIPANLPEKPVLFERNKLVLAGGVLGLLAGLLLVEAWGGAHKLQLKETAEAKAQ